MLVLFLFLLMFGNSRGELVDRHGEPEKRAQLVFHAPLDAEERVVAYWTLDYSRSNVMFEVHFPEAGADWFAFGFSDFGETSPADYCVLWTDWKGAVRFEDTRTDADGALKVDRKQDCVDFKVTRRRGLVKFAFVRQFDTCDDDDYIIEEGTTHVVWAHGTGPLYRLAGLNVASVPRPDSGMIRVQLLKNVDVDLTPPRNSWPLDILNDAVRVPSAETTYWCKIQRVPSSLRRRHHVVQFEAVIQRGHEGLVHHMELFHCVAPADRKIPDYSGPCVGPARPNATHLCKRVISAWAMGATPFTYPDDVGMPIGGPDFNPYVMLEVHYNNPETKADWVDSSGIRLHITSQLRRYDAGVIELGLEYIDKMAIPPGQAEFSLTGYCVTECTAVGLPVDGITVFGSQLHTHLTGVRVHTRHIRNGMELPELNRDNHYSSHFQEIRRLKRPVKILPGDALLTTCGYKTDDRTNVTLGGFAITDEMCVNYVHYYPATALEVCKSAISDEALDTYFRFLREWERQPTSADKVISENYKSVEWTPLRSQVLQGLYHEAPLGMQCNMSNGDRFPGYWDNTPITPVLRPLPPPARHCDKMAGSGDDDDEDEYE